MIKGNSKLFGINQGIGLKNLISEKIPLKRFVYVALTLNILNLITVLILQKNLPPQVPLFYGFAESEQQLTTTLGLIIPSIYSFAVVFINIIFTLFISSDYLKKILSIASFTISLLSIITVVKIIILVGFF